MTEGIHRIAALRTVLFALVWLSVAWFGSWHWNPNSAVRLFSAISIVEEGDATIDQFEHLTIDKAQFDSHFYLDKAPGMTLMAVPVVALADALSGETAAGKALSYHDAALDDYLKLRQWLVVALVNATLMALAALAVFELGRGLTGSAAAGVFGAIGFALATPLWGWATTLFGHAPVAALLAIAMWMVWRGTRDPGDFGGWPAATGVVLGWMLVIEHSALLFGIPVGLWALWRMRGAAPAHRWRAAIDAVLGCAFALLAILAYNQFAYGEPFRLGYQGVVGFEGMRQGLFGLTTPDGDVLGEILWGERRGILWVAPIVVAALPGLAVLWRSGRRDVALLAMGGAAVAFLYNASYVYWDGGNSTGPRHAMPAVAFLALAFAPAWHATATPGRLLLASLLTVSVALNCAIAAAEITAPHDAANVLFDGVWARLAPGYLRTVPNEFFGTTPWAGLMLYLLIAAPLGCLLVALARQVDAANIYRTDGAARHA